MTETVTLASLIALARFLVFVAIILNLGRHYGNVYRLGKFQGWKGISWYLRSHPTIMAKAALLTWYTDRMFFDSGLRSMPPDYSDILILNFSYAAYWLLNLFPFRGRGARVSASDGTIVHADGTVEIDFGDRRKRRRV